MNKEALIEELYVSYGKTMLFVAMKSVNQEIARDLVQDCFVKLMEMELPKIVTKEQWKYYLIRMISNRCIDYFRKEKRHSTWTYIDEWDEPSMRSKDFPLESVVMKEEVNELAQCMKQLDDIYKSVLYLYYCEGVKLKTIGNLLGITSQTAGMRLSRGRRLLRADLEDRYIRV